MKIEHIALNVEDPAAMAKWHCEHFGMNVASTNGVGWFVADDAGQTLLEIYNNPDAPLPDYASMDPLVLHLAFVCGDIEGDRARLLEAGCTPCGEPTSSPNGDAFAMLRDPWGLAIQLVNRATPLV